MARKKNDSADQQRAALDRPSRGFLTYEQLKLLSIPSPQESKRRLLLAEAAKRKRAKDRKERAEMKKRMVTRTRFTGTETKSAWEWYLIDRASRRRK